MWGCEIVQYMSGLMFLGDRGILRQIPEHEWSQAVLSFPAWHKLVEKTEHGRVSS